ncbi:MAG TPA: cytochrome c oxidase assembly protein [Gaiellaceae bacterium]|nr:cytochrome c oxidase assembly protein [Gaiellaceae bacterium]
MGPSPLTSWTWDPAQLLLIAAAAFLYYRRAATLARRGTPVPEWRRRLFGLGLALAFLAAASPIHAFGEEQFFFAHMVQHVLLGDLAPLCMVAGLTGPLLRPVLAMPAIMRLRFLTHPLVAFPIWAVNLVLWHVPFAYEGALHHDAVHAVQHILFFTCGCVMWAPVLEVLPGPEWFGTGMKLGYIVAVRLVETILGNVFIWSGGVFYHFYEHPEERWGISAHADQGIAGGLMMIEGSLVTLGALAWLFLRLGKESELRQQLLEQGVDPRAATRAVRYGRGQELSGPP